MRPAGEKLAELLDDTRFSDCSIPVICAVDGKPYGNADDIRTRMKKQVYSPVRWSATISWCASQGVTSIVECGPGKVLTGLIRRIDKSLSASCVDSAASIRTAISGAA
jgi:[acyl-carrier-protein] S-malonyltransferase